MCNSPRSFINPVTERLLCGGLSALLLVFLFVADSAAQATQRAKNQSRLLPGSRLAELEGMGRGATAKEVAAWDIDVRPDFKGLPKGAGTVAQGQGIWEAKCASCHGVFGESNEVFSPLVGGTTAQDIKSGQVASLKDNSYPGRTTMMKLATVSTLWDYINRAMPWNAPKSLSADEVYAVTAFVLNLGGVVPDDFVLSDTNIAQVQARLPNRTGMSTAHTLWPGPELGGNQAGHPKASACMTHCGPEPKVASKIPAYARSAHGNLAEQNRLVGAQIGVQTTAAATVVAVSATIATDAATATTAPPKTVQLPVDNARALALATRHSCTACHGMTQKLVGPAFSDIARKYPTRVDYLLEKIIKGGSGVWGPIPMPPQSMPEADALHLAHWLAAGAQK